MPRSNKKRSPFKIPAEQPPAHLSSVGPSTSSLDSITKNEIQVMISRAVSSARKHGINLMQGTPNAADGNCALESAIFNVRDRDCFPDKLPLSVDYYRILWMTDMRNRTVDDKTWNIYSHHEWEAGWNELMESGVYERGLFGDLMLFAIACGLRKVILIFNTNLCSPHDPIYICDPRKFGIIPDTEIPIVMAYNLAHYESLNPAGVVDIAKTVEVVEEYKTGRYTFSKKDIPFLLETVDADEKNNPKLIEDDSPNKEFQNSLPAFLKGKRPRDMDKEEKKEYNKLRMKFSRKNETELDANMRKHKNAENMKTARSKETQDEITKRQKKENAAKAKKIANATPEEGLNRKAKEKKSKQAQRDQTSEEEKNNRQKKDNAAKAKKIVNANPEEGLKRKSTGRKSKQAQREKASEEEKTNIRKKDNAAKAAKIADATPEESILRKNKEKAAKQQQRAKRIPTSKYAARNALKVLSGEQLVLELKDTENSIGSMDVVCTFCQARKWKSETPTHCCNNGKVDLPRFPDPPEIIQKLLKDENVESKLFRENTRIFNNALALSSIQVNEKRFRNGYCPSVIFEGKVTQYWGPMLPDEGQEPRFAQLYIHDPATEHTSRFKNMSIPSSLSQTQITILRKTLEKLQKLFKDVNPFVQDLLHVCEIPDDELKEGKIVISCKRSDRPKNSHDRRYNLQQNLSEVSVLTNSVPGDLVLRKRGGGLQQIYDLHPAAQALHFVLIFPFGTLGYSEFMKHNDDKKTKRVSPREYFAFHLNMRNPDSDFLFRFARLFQEYLCLAFTTMESQRLKFHKNNQGALRADSYKNVKNAVVDLVPIGDRISRDDHQLKIGKRIVLSKSFVGSPR